MSAHSAHSAHSINSVRTVNSVEGPTESQRAILERAKYQKKVDKIVKNAERKKREEKKQSEIAKTERLRQIAVKANYIKKTKLNEQFMNVVEEIKQHKKKRREYMLQKGVSEEQLRKYDSQTRQLTSRLYKRLFRYLKPEKLAKKFQPGETLENSRVALENYKKTLTDLIIKLVKETRDKTEEINRKLANTNNNNEKANIKFKAMNKKRIDMRTLSSLILALDDDTYRVFLYFMTEYKQEIGIEYINIIKQILIEQYYLMKLPKIVKNNASEERLEKKALHSKYRVGKYKSDVKKYPKKKTNKKTENQKEKRREKARKNRPVRQVKAQNKERKVREEYNKNFPKLQKL